MPAHDIKLILCDLGNVLINFDHRIAVRRIQNYTSKEFDDIYQLFFDSPLTKDFEEGRVTPGIFFESLKKELKIKGLTFKKFSSIWNEIFFANEEMLGVLKALKERFRLCLISNVNELHYRYIRSRFPRHIDLFDEVYLSYEVGVRKPHRDIYLKALAAAHAAPQETLYIDDRADLIEEAKKLKLVTILFKDTDSLKKKLKELKIIL